MGSQSANRTKRPIQTSVLQDVFSHSLCESLGLDDEISTLYSQEKLSLKQIARQLGVSRDRIRAGLTRAGVKVRGERRALDFTGQTPFGWKREKGRLAPHAAEQKMISRMAHARRDGLSLHAIARALTAEGVRTKKGGRWHAKSVSQILECNARLLAEHEEHVRNNADVNP